ncbi:MAG TPA: S8 family serine peptidase, partial [Xanthobacteraceae bacterium]|nr:S8 family serine peptidase [Xanthobacteraceae bacterium]
VGFIQIASATGSVTGTGPQNGVGGFAGMNAGEINQAFSTGVVTGGADSFVGGFAGINATLALGNFDNGELTHLPGNIGSPATTASISQSFATGSATGGDGSTVGGLVGVNGADIDQTYAVGAVTTTGSGGTTGGLVAVNNSDVALPPAAPSVLVANGNVTNSYWSTDATGQQTSAAGDPLTTAQLMAALPQGFAANIWSINAGASFPFLTAQGGNGIPTPPPGPGPVPLGPQDPCADLALCGTQLIPTQQVNFFTFPTDPNLTIPPPLLTALTTNDLQPPSNPAAGGPGNGPGPGIGRTLSERTISGVPPLGETRFVPNEVILQISSEVSRDRLDRLARQLGLTIISSKNFGLVGRTIYRFRMAQGSDIRDIIRKLEANQIVASAQPNYVFKLGQEKEDKLPAPGQAGADAGAGADAQNKLQSQDPQNKDSDVTGNLTVGDSAQYVIEKLKLGEVHRRVRGDNVTIAVIDSEIDSRHPDLQGAVVEKFDAVGGPDKPHVHGTAMAGAIASHHRLLGVAPGVRVLAVRAFGDASASAEGTSYSILQGLDWAMKEGARIVNMSFAGPRDPMLERVLKTAHDKGIVLVAAAGNAGPKSPPLFPGADPSVIAVTATDVNNRLFTMANRGKYVAVAAPGVDILAAAPDGSYQLTTGTSVAAAHVSGVAALLLERNPKLTPDAVRKILTSSADKLGAKSQPDLFGAGLVDPERALSELSGATSDATGSVRRVTH